MSVCLGMLCGVCVCVCVSVCVCVYLHAVSVLFVLCGA